MRRPSKTVVLLADCGDCPAYEVVERWGQPHCKVDDAGGVYPEREWPTRLDNYKMEQARPDWCPLYRGPVVLCDLEDDGADALP